MQVYFKLTIKNKNLERVEYFNDKHAALQYIEGQQDTDNEYTLTQIMANDDYSDPKEI